MSYAEIDALDREGNELRYVWDIRAESKDRKMGGDTEAALPSIPAAIENGQRTARITFRAPMPTGGYRLFVTVYDGQSGAVAHNLHFYVEE